VLYSQNEATLAIPERCASVYLMNTVSLISSWNWFNLSSYYFDAYRDFFPVLLIHISIRRNMQLQCGARVPSPALSQCHGQTHFVKCRRINHACFWCWETFPEETRISASWSWVWVLLMWGDSANLLATALLTFCPCSPLCVFSSSCGKYLSH